MSKRALVLAILSASLISFFSLSPPAHAGVYVRFGVPFPPPPLRHEVVVVRPGPGYAWVGGYWNWRPGYHRYVWVPGYWAHPPRPHAIWVGPHYSYRHHHHYYRRGYWR